MSAQEYNRQLEYLELEHLRKVLKHQGLTFEQQKEIELKIFDTKKAMLQKIEDEERQASKINYSNSKKRPTKHVQRAIIMPLKKMAKR